MPPRRKPKQSATNANNVLQQLTQYASEFQQYLQAECGLSENTWTAYRRDLEQFLAWMRTETTTDVRKVTVSELSAYLQTLNEQGYAATSVARKLVALKMFYRFLLLNGIIAESVADVINAPKLWDYLPTVLSPEKVEELLQAPHKDDAFYYRNRAILTMLYATGARASELANIELSKVNLEEQYCKVRGKGDKERLVSLNPVAVTALEAYLDHERPQLVKSRDTAALFLSRTGRALTRGMIWNVVKTNAERIGCGDRVSPHTLRHSFATHMLAGGAEIRALQELLGHASIRTTQVYTHVEHSRLKTIHQKCHPRG